MANPIQVIFPPSVYLNLADLTVNNAFTGTNTFSENLIITKAIGTAPFTITSTTKVANLNADTIDGLHIYKGNGTTTAGTETTITDANATSSSTILLQSTSSGFAGLSPYISTKGTGSFVITTTVALGTETFDYLIIN